jgi:starch synthase
VSAPVRRVLISHPHAAAVSCGFAMGLARAEQLAAFVTGAAVREESAVGRLCASLSARHRELANRILPGIPAGRLRGLAPVELGARLAAEALSRAGVRTKRYDAVFTAHDAAVSVMPWPKGTTDVYAYEDAALWTFRRAARADIGRIWDLPLPHYATIEQMYADEARRWPEAADGPPHREPDWKRRRKDAELALATTVSVASAFTKKSLEALDVRVSIVEVAYGFPVEQFAPRERAPSGPFTVLAVGTQDLRKGTPDLLEAWRRAEIPDAELHLIGPLKLAKPFLDRYAGRFRHWPHLAKTEIADRYRAADLLAFPTLGDGFGLVMQEAMCCGTPVVTTPCGGGPESITDGVDGWIVPPRDVDALVERFRQAAADRDRTAAIGKAARARAERFTWRESGDALVRALET